MMTVQEIESVTGSKTFAQMMGITAQQAFEMAERGYDMLNGGAADDARKMFEGLVVMNPRDARMWASLGVAYEQLDRRDDAAHAFNACIQLEPEHEMAKRHLKAVERR